MSLKATAAKLERRGDGWTPAQWQNWNQAIAGMREGLDYIKANLALVPDDAWPEIIDLGTEAIALKAFGKKWSTMIATCIEASPRVIGQHGPELLTVAANMDTAGKAR